MKRKRGRPATFDRAAALDTATRLFWRHGYDGTSISMLTEALGVTPPTLYAAFGSKEQLYEKALECYSEMTQRNQAGLVNAESTYETVRSLLRGSAMGFTASDNGRGCMLMVGAVQHGPGGDGAAQLTKAARVAVAHQFEAILAAGKAMGDLPASTDTRTLARFYVSVVQGMAVQAIDGASRDDLEALVDVALQAWPSPQQSFAATEGESPRTATAAHATRGPGRRLR